MLIVIGGVFLLEHTLIFLEQTTQIRGFKLRIQ
jgi:hypothetical protein